MTPPQDKATRADECDCGSNPEGSWHHDACSINREPSTPRLTPQEDSYLRFDDMTWPNPTDPSGVEWQLRYGTPSRMDLLVAASFISAYANLIELPVRERNKRVAQMRKLAY